jgi:hypothetical protein
MSDSGDFNIYFYTTIIFAIASIVTLILYHFSSTSCPPPRIITTGGSKFSIVPTTVDLQFSQSNFPSVVYDDVFTGSNVFQGGYSLDTSSKSTDLRRQ